MEVSNLQKLMNDVGKIVPMTTEEFDGLNGIMTEPHIPDPDDLIDMQRLRVCMWRWRCRIVTLFGLVISAGVRTEVAVQGGRWSVVTRKAGQRMFMYTVTSLW